MLKSGEHYYSSYLPFFQSSLNFPFFYNIQVNICILEIANWQLLIYVAIIC